jgi:hypothetical protein
MGLPYPVLSFAKTGNVILLPSRTGNDCQSVTNPPKYRTAKRQTQTRFFRYGSYRRARR